MIFTPGLAWIFLNYIQHCFICRPPDSSVSEDAGIEPRTGATLSLGVRHSNHSVSSLQLTLLDLNYTRLDLIHLPVH
jgi:hypothetical protein